jgi:hypothetical protein
MRRFLSVAVLALVAFFFSAPASRAQVGKGLSGPHYNLNIIGVPKGKTADMTGSNRHTVFVPLDTSGEVAGNVKIYFVAGDEFQVLDGNATDADGATIEVPHGDPGTVCYDVFAVGLGKPGGSAHVDAEVLFDDSTHDVLLALDQVSFNVSRNAGKPKRENISNIFRVSGCTDLNDTGVCDAGDQFFNNEWVFNVDQLLSYWWDYQNTGLKLMQIRFYDCSLGNGLTAASGPSVEMGPRAVVPGLTIASSPSQPVQRISYSLPAGARVRLAVYSVSGRLVAELVNETRPAGEYVAEWNAGGVASGIYFSRLEVERTVVTRRLSIVH